MRMHPIKQVIDESNKQLEEGIGLDSAKKAIITTIIFQILIVSIDYIVNKIIIPKFFPKKMPKYSKEWSEKIRNITNLDINVFIVKDGLNAWNKGTNEVFITKDLMKHLNERQIMSILLHEVGHYANKDVRNLRVRWFMGSVFTFYLYWLFTALIHWYPGLIAWTIGSYIVSFLDRPFGRKAEFLADSYANAYDYGKDLSEAFDVIAVQLKKEFCKEYKGKNKKEVCDLIVYQNTTSISRYLDEHPLDEERKVNLSKKDLFYTIKLILNPDGKEAPVLILKSRKEIKKAYEEMTKEAETERVKVISSTKEKIKELQKKGIKVPNE